jgi:hypothetical protein
MNRLLIFAILFFAWLPTGAFALDPDRREVVVVSGRIWDGYAYKETFLPSTAPRLSLLDGKESAITFVRTQEYWPLSRQVYVDFERQHDEVAGVLRISRDGSPVAAVEPSLYAIVYPKGAVNGDASLVWGTDAEAVYAEYEDGEKAFARLFVKAQQAQSDYERRLLAAAVARKRGGKVEPVAAPEPAPEPSLRLVTKPLPGYRVMLPAGDYEMELEVDGKAVTGTKRGLRIVAAEGSRTVVADIVPEERWTQPIASNSPAARVFARAGTTFYMTLSDADRFDEAAYLPVISPQADAVVGRLMWVRRKPSTLDRLEASWHAATVETVLRNPLKVEQTSGSGFGYRVRPAKAGETADLDAFAVTVPSDPSLDRGAVRAKTDPDFSREIVVVHPRQAGLSLGLVALPMAIWAALALLRRRQPRSACRP